MSTATFDLEAAHAQVIERIRARSEQIKALKRESKFDAETRELLMQEQSDDTCRAQWLAQRIQRG